MFTSAYQVVLQVKFSFGKNCMNLISWGFFIISLIRSIVDSKNYYRSIYSKIMTWKGKNGSLARHSRTLSSAVVFVF